MARVWHAILQIQIGGEQRSKISLCVAVICCVPLLGGIAVAQEKALVEKVLDGCSKEVETCCKDVTLGKGQLLSCLYAYEVKISTDPK